MIQYWFGGFDTRCPSRCHMILSLESPVERLPYWRSVPIGLLSILCTQLKARSLPFHQKSLKFVLPCCHRLFTETKILHTDDAVTSIIPALRGLLS